jgi:agmatine/peptidylarginine deiminase
MSRFGRIMVIASIILMSISLSFAGSGLDGIIKSDKILPVKPILTKQSLMERELLPRYYPLLPPPEGFRYSEAEFSHYFAVLIQWPTFGGPEDSLFEYFTSMTLETSKAAKVFLTVSTEIEKEYLMDHLVNRGADPKQLKFFIVNNDSVWSRDFGPQYVFDENGNASLIDLLYFPERYFDDMIPDYIEKITNLPGYDLPLYFEGGNLMADGVSTCSFNEGLYDYNPQYSRTEIDQMMKDYCGCERSIVLPYTEAFFHIDLATKYITKNKVLVAEAAVGNMYYDYLENIATIFNNSMDCDGNPYTVIRIPIQFDGSMIPKSYLNSLIINNRVLVPIFNDTTNDDQALEIYRNAMPGYEVVGIDSTSIYQALGAVHCTTKGIPDIPFSVGISTDKTKYNVGEYVNASLTAFNPNETVNCDLYLTIKTPDGKLLYYPGWSETKTPVLSNLIIPSNFELYDVEVFNWKIDKNIMPINVTGNFQISTFMTKPGSDVIIGVSHSTDIEISNTCLTGMILVDNSSIYIGSNYSYKANLTKYCIDKYEFPNKLGEKPQSGLSWYESKTACEDQGKRLCTEAEWENACKGIASYGYHYNYPYGTVYKPGFCPDYAKGIQPSGSYPMCTGLHNVYDMNGNVWEWVSDWYANYPSGTYNNPTGPSNGFTKVMRGGDFWSAVWGESSCTYRGSQGLSFKDSMIGFRCCSNVNGSE